ncbi:pyridoxamine phosphate oxidase [Grosmannia clavigera kw1407]|uniref:pyridoxal 5'-phosphate synthase n=1 Tax=Grosmannia clavigera (strain kw1407 / UAMH 11150) TaxID=655863 RepID=F0XHZ5_GROCL|nr:pyridoxamine phosphate oxidase [Grosmannia clavigera kw1407]EFX03085.1 pyridoxamine phosphate oxidase [Grosmannia clavigera kw1407]
MPLVAARLLPRCRSLQQTTRAAFGSMALYQSPSAAATASGPARQDKLIFAPSPLSASAPGTPAPAGQFTKHEQDGGLRRVDLSASGPVAQFHAWFAEARAAGIAHPESCTLATASLPSGRVSARVVYLKELDPLGFVLYSNFGTSRKAADLFGTTDGAQQPNPWAALTFWWEPLERQVRVEGRVVRLPAAESQLYFDTRVRGSRIGAWASRQSQVLTPAETGNSESADDGRTQLEQWVAEAQQRFGIADDAGHIPVPDFWGGLRIVPERVEFWQGRKNRLHDRFVYDRVSGSDGAEDSWSLNRLSP